jgi:C1A family cysteine protease
MIHRYDWKPDLPDHRDLKFGAVHSLGLVNLPQAVDLRQAMPPVVDQGQTSSCTSNALAAAMGFLELSAIQTKTASVELFDAAVFTPYSRLFIYWNERDIEGDTGQDGGAQIRDGVKSLAAFGGCRETTWAFDPKLLFQKPTDAAFTEATAHKVTSYSRLESVQDMKQCLAAGFPFVFGATIYDSFESPLVSSSGVVPMPSKVEECLGGHAITCAGYDDARQVFIVRNSWGTLWGDKGYCYFPYAYLANQDLCSDMWTLRK